MNKDLEVLVEANLNKWKITDDLRKFPKELLKKLYDKDQRVLFGSDYTKGIVIYYYIDEKYTVNGNHLYVSCSIRYNGKGCDLTDKETIEYKDLFKMFPENK